MTGASYIANFLEGKKIDTVFELQGGMITRIIDELSKSEHIRIVSMHHEQAAAFAIDAYARVTGRPGVALATSGPGALNLLTGIGNCFFDSVPALFITGQVNLNEQKGDRLTRQLGFQETDVVSMSMPITKKSYAVKKSNDIPYILEEAYQIAISGRQGPVLIDIPMNIQNMEIDPFKIENSFFLPGKGSQSAQFFFQRFLDALRSSERPLILVGRGIRASGATELFKEFIRKYQIPVVTSLLGLDVLPYSHSQRVGFIGTYGNRWANYALGTCDLLLVLGSRLDLRQTGADVRSFQEGKLIYHVDIEKAELNNRITVCLALQSDLFDFFSQIKRLGSPYKTPIVWEKDIEERKQARLDTEELVNIAGINPNIFIHELSRVSSKARVFTADVGNNQMWTSQSLELAEDQLFITSGGMGAMGYSLPAAIGSSLSLGNAPIVSIIGDGGFQINIQELQTVAANKLPIKIVILNNHCLGMIRQFQDAYFNGCYQSTVNGYSAPDFEKLAKAYDIDSVTISSPEEVEYGLNLLWEKPDQPFLLNVSLDIHTNVYPKTMFGSPITKMEPLF